MLFDTIRMKAYVEIDPKVLPLEHTKPKHWVEPDTGEVCSTYQVKDNRIHFMRYATTTNTLIIEVSIPKFLFGNNVVVLSEADIDLFWNELNEHLLKRLNVSIERSSWFVERLDVCFNFHVGDKVNEYIRLLGKKQLPYHHTVLWNHAESVVFQNKSSRMSFYDKQKECVSHKEPDEVIQDAEGILRFEVTPTRHEMANFSSKRLAADFFSKHFFDYVMSSKKVQSALEICNTQIDGLDFAWLQTQSLSRIETLIGFESLLNTFGEAALKPLYNPQTFNKRKQLVQTLQIPSCQLLEDLTTQLPV